MRHWQRWTRSPPAIPNMKTASGREPSYSTRWIRPQKRWTSIFQPSEHSDEDMRMFYVIGYEELAIPYIKKCMEAGNTQRAHDTACKLVQLNPSSDLGLRYAINTSALLKQYDKFQQYTEQGLQYYPNEPFYQTKLATIYDRDKQYDLSIGLLHPIVQKYPDNKEVIGAFSQSSEYRALQLSKSRKDRRSHRRTRYSDPIRQPKQIT